MFRKCQHTCTTPQIVKFVDLTSFRRFGHYYFLSNCFKTLNKRNVSVCLSVKPYVPHLPLSSRLRVGSDVKFSCPAWGYDEPSMSWLKDGQPITPSSRVRLLTDSKNRPNRTLSITDLQESDRANYSCVARNKHGVMLRTTFLRVSGIYSCTFSML